MATSAEWARRAEKNLVGIPNDRDCQRAQAQAAISVALAFQEAAVSPELRQIGWMSQQDATVHTHPDSVIADTPTWRNLHADCIPVWVPA